MNNQRVVILGGSQGIGLAVAQQAAKAGALVVIASSKRANVDRALESLPRGATGAEVDLRSSPAIGRFFGNVGAFDHLVYTAGENLLLSPLNALDLDEARRFFELRFWSAITAVKLARPHLRANGSIVLTGGSAAHRPGAGFVVGASICGAMESLTRALAIELAPVRVNIVVPGFVETGLWNNIPADARAEMFRSAAAKLPVGRIGTPDDIAEHYLAFMRGGYTTGQSIIVDGGAVLS